MLSTLHVVAANMTKLDSTLIGSDIEEASANSRHFVVAKPTG
jgi:hypothetical protein